MLFCFVLQVAADHHSFSNCAACLARPFSSTHHCFPCCLLLCYFAHYFAAHCPSLFICAQRPSALVVLGYSASCCISFLPLPPCHSPFNFPTVQGVLQDVELNQRMTEVCRQAVRAFVEDRTDKDGRVSIKALNKFAQMTGFGAPEPWVNVIKVCLLCLDTITMLQELNPASLELCTTFVRPHVNLSALHK